MSAAPDLNPATAGTPGVELYGSFMLGEDEFALPASCIREVVNFPERMTALPLAPPYLEGMFTLRGAVIPVLNLGRLFDPSAPAASAGHKIAIIDHQQVLVGILFHGTGEILRVRPEQRSALHYASGDGHGVIAGTILLDGGARLLQILNADRLIHVENVPQVLALRAAGARQDSQRYHAQADKRQCVCFRAGGSLFAFDMGAIQEIIAVPEMHSSILNSPLCLGRINFRGSQVAVVDFAALLQTTPASDAPPPGQRIIIVRIDDATTGFLVDSVDHIVSFYPDELMPIPLLGQSRSSMFGGCIVKPGIGDIIVLDHRAIFSRTELVEMRNGHSNLYPAEQAGAAATPERGRASKRQVYITFKLDHTFALDIKQVREIIDFSDAVTRAPGLPPCMRGILNLRQQMISVVDLRELYGMAPCGDAGNAKILIIERGEERYGLLVDHVESILTIPDSQRYAAPRMMRNPDSDDPRAEMTEVIDVAGEDGAHKTLSVFGCEALLRRLAERQNAEPVT